MFVERKVFDTKILTPGVAVEVQKGVIKNIGIIVKSNYISIQYSYFDQNNQTTTCETIDIDSVTDEKIKIRILR